LHTHNVHTYNQPYLLGTKTLKVSINCNQFEKKIPKQVTYVLFNFLNIYLMNLNKLKLTLKEQYM